MRNRNTIAQHSVKPKPVLRYSEEPDVLGARSGHSDYLKPGLIAMHPSSRRGGFTLIEMLIVAGIIAALAALAIPAVLIAKKRAAETRIKADLNSIAQAIDAYKNDFQNQYPQFVDPITDKNSTGANGNGTWLDYSQARGAVLLCRALIGPGPANTTSSTAPPYYANPGDDGADGPGFRVRINVSGTSSSNNPILTGKLYGPYLDAAKFNVQYLNAPTAGQGTNGTGFPQAYPALFETVSGDWTDAKSGRSYKGSPILYYPAASGTYVSQQTGQVQVLSYTDPSTVNTGTKANAASRFNGFDNDYELSSETGLSFDPNSDFARLAVSAGSSEYLLWTAGSSGKFGLINGGKSDNITNFDLPANLKK
jgi:prepilin-type N-terminal cleavage/methylation domain-containing protein